MQNQIPKKWQKVKLGELIKDGVILQIQDGNHGEKHPKQSDFVKSGDRIPFIMANDLNSGKIDFNNCNYISKKQADNLRIGFAKFGDVLLTHKGNLGLVSIVPEMEFDYLMLTPQVTYYRVDKRRLDNHFLKYVFLNPSFQKALQNISPQSTRPYVGITAQRDLEINFIGDIQDQKKIASFLSALDDKIEVNNKIANTLEDMAQALFKEWFANFRFPGYEKAEFVDSEFGKIPKKWKVGLIKNLGRVITGKTPSTEIKENFGSEIPFITIPDMNSTFVVKTERYLSEKGSEKMKSMLLPADSICVSCIATVGLVGITTQPSLTNQQVNSVIPNKEVLTYFLYLYFKNIKKDLELFGSGGTATLIINKTKFETLDLIIPDQNTLKDFHSIVKPMYEKILSITRENQKLAALRDLLLPKLMKGKIRL